MRGADLLTQALKDAGVTTIFSLSGNQIMPIYDACIDAGIRIVHTRHEAAAVYMADAWAQVTGSIGVAMVAGGPGFANSLSPLFSARHAESPVLLLSGDSPVAQDGMGAFQELDQTSMTGPVVKQARRSASADGIAADVAQLIDVAQSGRPGPVHLALPFDLLEATVQTVAPSPAATAQRSLSAADLEALAGYLNKAQRPVILTGPHCNNSRARQTLDRLRGASGIPVVPMESPRGLKDPTLGTFVQVLAQADLIVLIGKKLDFTLQFGRPSALPENAMIAMIDPDTDVIDTARRQLGERLVFHARADAQATLSALAKLDMDAQSRTDWTEQVAQAIAVRGLASEATPQRGAVLPQEVCTQVQALIEQANDPILICDGGEFGQWAQAFCHAPTRIINGVSGTIGGSLSYAIAAKIARPDATVIALLGDGTIGFHLAEFDTAARENAGFTAVIGNDLRWNAEHLIQVNSYGAERTIGCELSPDAHYHDVAQALGGAGFSATSAQEFEQALARAVNSGKPACINVSLQGLPAPVYTVD